VLIAIVLAIGYVVADFAMTLYGGPVEPGTMPPPYRIFGAFVLVVSLAIHVVAMFLAGVMVNQLVEAAAYKRNLFHPPEVTPAGLVSSFLTVGVSFWAGMLPGVVLGQLFFGVTRFWWLSLAVTFATAFLLAPIGILGAYYNGSAFQIISSDVIRTVRTHTAGWIRFYSWMALWIAMYCAAWLFRLIPMTLISSTLCALVEAASLLLMGRTLGLLAQAFINFWVQNDEE
jgi:hypothetical protein